MTGEELQPQDMPVEQPMAFMEEDLPKLNDLLNGCAKEDISARRSEVRVAWRQRAALAGLQQVYWSDTQHLYLGLAASGLALPRYMDVWNIYKPHWRSFVSILSQNPPGVNFVPKNLQSSPDVTAADYAEKMRSRVDREVNMRDRQGELAGLFCTDGRVVSWTRLDSEGKLRVTMHGVLESKPPIYVRHMQDWGYCLLSEEVDLYEARAEADRLLPRSDVDEDSVAERVTSTSGLADTDYERYARLNIIGNKRSGASDGLKSMTTRTVGWIRPSRYRKASRDIREKLQQLCPDGIRITRYGDQVVEAIPESMDTALVVQWPSPGQGASRPSLLHDIIAPQDAYNDYKNNLRDAAGYVNTATWVDTDLIDPESIPEQRSEPGAIHAVSAGGKGLAAAVFQEQSSGLSPELIAQCEQIKQDVEFISGDLPAVYGGDTEGQDTVGVNKLLSASAKGQLSMAWAATQWMFAGIYELAVPLAAQMFADQDSLAVQGPNGEDSFDPRQILQGAFGCYPDADSSFPETMADKRASLQAVLSQLGAGGQQGAEIVFQPDNLKLIKQFSGLTDLIIPGAEARDKQLREIEQLLREVPIPPDPNAPPNPNGQPAQASPSVPVDVVYDDHKAEYAKVTEWLSSDARFEAERKGNSAGIQNVKLHGNAHKAAMDAANVPAPLPPPKVSLTMAVTDPTTIAEAAQAAGLTQSTPQGVAASQQPDQQKVVADTQLTTAKTAHAASQAQRESVLAARDRVTPIDAQHPVVKVLQSMPNDLPEEKQ